MKKLLFLLLIGGYGLVWAETNSPAAKKDADQHLKVTAHQLIRDPVKQQLIYSGNVWVLATGDNLNCERLVIDLPPRNNQLTNAAASTYGTTRPTNIVAEGGVTIVALDDKGDTNHIIADTAVYSYTVIAGLTNELITLTTNVSITNSSGFWQMGDHFTYDLQTKLIKGDGNISSGFDGKLNFGKDTNASPLHISK